MPVNSKFEIDFKRGQQVKERLRRAGFNAMVPISIEVDDQSVVGMFDDKFFKVYIWPTLDSLIVNMEKYESDYSFEIPVDLAAIYVESDGQNVELYLYLPSSKQAPERYGDLLTVPVKAFAAEAITTVEKFVEYFLDVCPEYTEEDVMSTLNLLTDAREWYEQKYDESV